jgi:hypothetical protein
MLKSLRPWVPGNPNDRSVTGFRIRNGGARGPMSRTFYYKMKAEGIGPRETFLSATKVIITPADELAWQERRANPRGTEARLIAKAEEMRRSRGRKAGRAAAQSPRHISKGAKAESRSRRARGDGA